MAWTAPMTFVSGAALTAAQLNTYLRDNLNETSPAKASTTGSYFVGAGSNSIVERTFAQDFIGTNETTTSTSAADLATVGPSVTRTTGVSAIVMITCTMSNNTANGACLMGFEVSGASTVGVTSAASIRLTSATANAIMQASFCTLVSLTSGSNTFTTKYLVGSNTGAFSNRRILVMPL